MSNNDINNGNNNQPAAKKPRRFLKFLLTLFCVLLVICVIWTAFALFGRVKASSIIPDSAERRTSLRVSVANPVRLLENVLSHDSLQDISTVQALAPAIPVINMLQKNPLLKNGFVRYAAGGNLELALLPLNDGMDQSFAAAWDFRLLSPLLRILPFASNFVNIPNLYYVQSGKNSRFEMRIINMTLYIAPYRNLLFITNNSKIFESRTAKKGEAYSAIKPSSYDASLILSNEFISGLLAEQDAGIAAAINNLQFDSMVEAGLSIYQKKIEFHLAAPLSSRLQSLSRILEQRSRVPGMAEQIPADAQYATILSAGTLNELYQAALVFSPGLNSALRTAENASRAILGLTLDDLLFSWTGNEFAVFGLEGRPHPVYAIQISNEQQRQKVFDRAFRSVVLNENVRLNMDGERIPQIEVPEFLQALLRQWDIFIPSPYYRVYRDFFLLSESADALLAALRAMQRNEVLPKTATWRNIAGGRTVSSAVSLYYSLDLSMPFFLRKNTALSGFLSLYRQGLIRMSFDRNSIDFSFALVPGSGSGVTLVNGYPIDAGARPSNRIFAGGSGDETRVFYTSGSSAYSLKVSDNTIQELPNQGTHWIIAADGVTPAAGDKNKTFAWVVTDRGRVTLADSDLEPAAGFPVLMGLRLSAPPQAYEGRLYLCDEDGKVHVIDQNGKQTVWETVFDSAIRSAPSFLTTARKPVTYAAVYPKSFFGEIWLLDANGKAFPNWPAPISISSVRADSSNRDDSGDNEDYEEGNDFGIGFGSPLLFVHNNRVNAAFVNQSGQLLIYDDNAVLFKNFPVSLDGVFYQQPVFDGEYLWLVSSNGTFFRITLDGEVLSQNIPGFSVMEEGFITIFDSDNDKTPEIYFTGDGNALYAFTRHFRSLEGFPLPIWGRPVFIPAQGNKKAEIFGMGMDRRLYRYQFR